MIRKHIPAVSHILVLLLVLAGCSTQRTAGSTTSANAAPARPGNSAMAAVSPEPPAMTIALDDSLPVDPDVRIGHLSNGMTYYIRRNGEPKDRLELRLVVNAGSVLEDEDQRGLAHFLEHMAFNGTESFEKQELVNYLESIGMRFGPDLNAYTSFDETVFMLQMPVDSTGVVETGVQILEEWAHRMTLEPVEIDKERGVVLEEWRLGRGADARISDKQMPVLFHDSRYAERLPIGKPDIIRNAQRPVLEAFYESWYRPDLMAIVAAGDIDPDRLEALIRDRFEHVQPRPGEPGRPLYPMPDHEQTLFLIVTDPEATGNEVSIYFKHDIQPEVTVRDYRRRIVESLYNTLLNSRLDELSRRADPPFLNAWSATARIVRPMEAYVLGADVADNGIERGFEAILTESERVRRYGFTDTELERGKRELLRMMENAWNERESTDSQVYAAEYTRNYLEDEPIPGITYKYALYRAFVPGITLDEVNAAAERLITRQNRVIMADGPEKEGVAIPSEDDLHTIMERVAAAEVAPYEDMAVDVPLMKEPPRPGRVVKERLIEEIGVTEWVLGNGVRVVIKPTDFKKDEILLSAYSPGGQSLVPLEDLVPARTADTIVNESGIGPFTEDQLTKLLADKVADVTPYISDLTEGMTGSASVQDLETMFQLVYLSFTAPREDSTAFLSVRNRLRGYIQNRSADPQAAFSDTLSLTLAQYNLRALPWTPAILDKMDLERSYAIYRDRFADASDFTFFLVGAFEPEKIRGLVETYLGSLPETGRVESWRDVGLRYPEGTIEKDVTQGIESRSTVAIAFTGPFEWTRENRYQAQSLVQALRILLREAIREEKGGTYGVGVGLGLDQYPVSRYQVTISFGADPTRVEDLIQAVHAQIDSVQAGALTPEYLEKVTEMQRRERETSLRDNDFWRSTLHAYYYMGEDPRNIMRYDELVAGLTLEDLRDTARRLLGTDDVVTVILYPANVTPTR